MKGVTVKQFVQSSKRTIYQKIMFRLFNKYFFLTQTFCGRNYFEINFPLQFARNYFPL